jgi:hypothetical protein
VADNARQRSREPRTERVQVMIELLVVPDQPLADWLPAHIDEALDYPGEELTIYWDSQPVVDHKNGGISYPSRPF